MYFRFIVTRGRLLAVALLVAGSSLELLTHSLSKPAQALPISAAAVNPEVSSAEVPLSLQLYRSRSEQGPQTQVGDNHDSPLSRRSCVPLDAATGSIFNGLRGSSKPLCAQALHERSGVLLS